MSIHIHLRRLLRSRVFLVTAILVLGLGLGVNLLLFNTAYALLWRPLNFPQPDRLATLEGKRATGELSSSVTGQEAWTLREQSAVVADVGLTGRRRLVSLFRGDEAIDMASAAVDSGYFRVLGLRPVAGRFFGEEEDLGDAPEQPAVLTEAAWKMHFGSDPSLLGRVFVVQSGNSRRQVRVIGIAPGAATLPFAADAEILMPLASASPGVRANSGDALYRCVVRLTPGVSMQQASAQAEAALQAATPKSEFGVWGRHWMEPLRQAVAPVKETTVLLLYGAACLLLVLVCANLASLFVARSLTRSHETSVHLALGASRWSMLGANFQEALLVCAAGTGFAFLVERWIRPLVPQFIPGVKNVGAELLATGLVLVAFGFLICLAVSCVVAAASGLRFRVDGLAGVLAQGGRTGGSGRFRAVLAAAQLAIVLTLLTASGMVGRSFLLALRSDPGLNAKGILTFQVSLPGSQRATLPVISELVTEIAAIPGAKGVTFAAESPVGSPAFATVTATRASDLRPGDPMIDYRLIGSAYFETLGARFVAGQPFSKEDVQRGAQVAILNESAQRLLFPGKSPIGRTVLPGLGDRRSVVGVVKDLRTEGLDRAAVPMVYVPYFPGWGLRFIVRTSSVPDTFLPLLRARVHEGSPGVLLQRFRSLSDILDETVQDRMVSGVLVGGFALLGLIVSSVGLYGTLAAQVQQRRREIAIRVALGATVRTVAATILGEGMRIMVFGVAAGIVGSVAAGRLIQRELYGVSSLDPTSFAAALLLLSGAALAACAIPAFKATRVDPIQALNIQ